MMMMSQSFTFSSINIMDQSGVVGGSELQDIVAALQKQIALDSDFARQWKTPRIKLNIVKNKRDPNIPVVYIRKNLRVPDAVGYHESDPENGVPIAFVSTKRAKREVEGLSGVLSHEILEMIVDPFERRINVGQNRSAIIEVGDPINEHTYRIDGLGVSNFVFPSWYDPKGKKPFDKLGILSKPLTISEQGYWSFFKNGNWFEVSEKGTKKTGGGPDTDMALLRRHKMRPRMMMGRKRMRHI